MKTLFLTFLLSITISLNLVAQEDSDIDAIVNSITKKLIEKDRLSESETKKLKKELIGKYSLKSHKIVCDSSKIVKELSPKYIFRFSLARLSLIKYAYSNEINLDTSIKDEFVINELEDSNNIYLHNGIVGYVFLDFWKYKDKPYYEILLKNADGVRDYMLIKIAENDSALEDNILNIIYKGTIENKSTELIELKYKRENL